MIITHNMTMSCVTIPIRELGKCHGTILLGAGKRPHPLVTAIPPDNPRKIAPRQKIHELSENRIADVHWPSSRKSSEKCQTQLKSTPANFARKAAENMAFLGNRFNLIGQ